MARKFSLKMAIQKLSVFIVRRLCLYLALMTTSLTTLFRVASHTMGLMQ